MKWDRFASFNGGRHFTSWRSLLLPTPIISVHDPHWISNGRKKENYRLTLPKFK